MMWDILLETARCNKGWYSYEVTRYRTRLFYTPADGRRTHTSTIIILEKVIVNYNRDSEKEVVFFSEPAVTMGLMNFKDN